MSLSQTTVGRPAVAARPIKARFVQKRVATEDHAYSCFRRVRNPLRSKRITIITSMLSSEVHMPRKLWLLLLILAFSLSAFVLVTAWAQEVQEPAPSITPTKVKKGTKFYVRQTVG